MSSATLSSAVSVTRGVVSVGTELALRRSNENAGCCTGTGRSSGTSICGPRIAVAETWREGSTHTSHAIASSSSSVGEYRMAMSTCVSENPNCLRSARIVSARTRTSSMSLPAASAMLIGASSAGALSVGSFRGAFSTCSSRNAASSTLSVSVRSKERNGTVGTRRCVISIVFPRRLLWRSAAGSTLSASSWSSRSSAESAAAGSFCLSSTLGAGAGVCSGALRALAPSAGCSFGGSSFFGSDTVAKPRFTGAFSWGFFFLTIGGGNSQPPSWTTRRRSPRRKCASQLTERRMRAINQ